MAQKQHRRHKVARFGVIGAVVAALLLFGISVVEWRTTVRILPWDPYAGCGDSTPDSLPTNVRIGLYEEFPVAERLDKLRMVDFPVTVAVAATSRADFIALRDNILRLYPQVREVIFWPVLSLEEGYYPGAWSDPKAVRRVTNEAEGLPVLWDSEMPRDQLGISIQNWWDNRTIVDKWLRARTEPVYVWRTDRNMGLNPLFLRMVAMHFDPADYPEVSFQLDLYHIGPALSDDQMKRIMRCGVEQYGNRFIPALGVLNDGEGSADLFVTPQRLRRDLELARQAGVFEVWLFGINGLNPEYLKVLRETLPVR